MKRTKSKRFTAADVEGVCRRFIELRYRLVPYLYCLFAEARRTGAPIMRPLLWHYQDDPVAIGVDDQFLLGRDLMVAPILRQGAIARTVYLPRGEWFDFWSGARLAGGRHVVAEAGLDTIALFARAGAIIPLGPVRQFIGDREPSVLTLHVWPGRDSGLEWYEDDGASNRYEAGELHRRRISYRRARGFSELRFSKAEGPFRSQVSTWQVVLHGCGSSVRASLAGRAIKSRWRPRERELSFTLANTASGMMVRLQ
jgi:alpha-glucosidase (family GH31 glycosyl hydrolase)